MAKYIQSVIGVLLLAFMSFVSAKSNFWTVAVYEHASIVDGYNGDAPAIMKANMDEFRRAAALAHQKNAKMIVFPEYGLYDVKQTRKTIKNYLEIIPNPGMVTWNPCKNPTLYPNTPVQYNLSCIAKENNVYLVANIGGKEVCDNVMDQLCPSDKQYQYSTNVVYSPTGKLIARYYKVNRYHESHFDSATSEAVTFDTPFGKFGTFINADILYQEPAINLVETYNVKNIVYPTAWAETGNVVNSFQVHPAFARGSGTNFLAANLYNPKTKAQGSGIFTPDGPTENNYILPIPHGRVIIGNITALDTIQEGTLISKSFNYKFLKKKFANVKMCYNDFCCHLSYKLLRRPFEVYALGVYNGLKRSANKAYVYVQICTLLKCPTLSKCGEQVFNVKTVFKQFSLKGENFISPYIYPSVVAMDGSKYSIQKSYWKYDSKKGLQSVKSKQIYLHSASLYSRVYYKDVFY